MPPCACPNCRMSVSHAKAREAPRYGETFGTHPPARRAWRSSHCRRCECGSHCAPPESCLVHHLSAKPQQDWANIATIHTHLARPSSAHDVRRARTALPAPGRPASTCVIGANAAREQIRHKKPATCNDSLLHWLQFALRCFEKHLHNNVH